MKEADIRNGRNTILEKYGMLGVLLIIILIFGSLSESFLTVQNFSNIFISESVVGCLALGGLFILVVDEFDLSLGYILCFCMVLGAFLSGKGFPGGVVVSVMIAAGAACGALNGLIVTKLGSIPLSRR